MNKPLVDNKKVIKNYISALLTDNEIKQEVAIKQEFATEQESEQTQQLNQLLQSVTVTEPINAEPDNTQPDNTEPDNIESVNVESVNIEPIETDCVEENTDIADIVDNIDVEDTENISNKVDADNKQEKHAITPSYISQKIEKTQHESKEYRNGSFQAMFFDVAGLTVAVPLVELGGIHHLEKTTTLMGKPDWFAGIMLHRDDKINVVDTARWVMPEKYDENLQNSLNYQYVIMLSKTHWGLLAEHLIDTVTLQQEDVKWVENSDKRPWLAGLVKDRMCALLEVESLIELLNNGINVAKN